MNEEKQLFNAALTTTINLHTAMKLDTHPKSCVCYGCALQKAVVEYALAKASENVAPIIEREREPMGFPVCGRNCGKCPGCLEN